MDFLLMLWKRLTWLERNLTIYKSLKKCGRCAIIHKTGNGLHFIWPHVAYVWSGACLYSRATNTLESAQSISQTIWVEQQKNMSDKQSQGTILLTTNLLNPTRTTSRPNLLVKSGIPAQSAPSPTSDYVVYQMLFRFRRIFACAQDYFQNLRAAEDCSKIFHLETQNNNQAQQSPQEGIAAVTLYRYSTPLHYELQRLYQEIFVLSSLTFPGSKSSKSRKNIILWKKWRSKLIKHRTGMILT